jgi:hypothetical protein
MARRLIPILMILMMALMMALTLMTTEVRRMGTVGEIRAPVFR